jgi:hypothetical protein
LSSQVLAALIGLVGDVAAFHLVQDKHHYLE